MKKTILILLLLLLFQNLASAYELKIVTVSGYSKPWIAISGDQAPMKDIKTARVHFHGWTQDSATGKGYRQEYDFDWTDPSKNPSDSQLKKFVEAYGMQREVDQDSSKIILIPLARGHCDQYGELADISKFDSAFKEVSLKLGLNLNQLKLRLVSAHSGGGAFLSKLLKNSAQSTFLSQTIRANFYDAIYQADTVNGLKSWISNNIPGELKQLRLFSIPNRGPSKYGEQIYSLKGSSETLQVVDIDGAKLKWKNKITLKGDWLSVLQEQAPYRLHHWSLVKTAWLF